MWGVVVIALAAFALIAVVSVLRAKLTFLPTIAWLLLIVCLPVIGPALWFWPAPLALNNRQALSSEAQHEPAVAGDWHEY